MPGTLQDFGCLVVLGADHTIRQASSNVSRYLARSAASVIGAPFSAVVDLSLCPQVLDVLARPSSPRRVTLHRVRYLPEPAIVANITVHRHNDGAVLEFEHCLTNGAPQTQAQYLQQQQRMQARLYQALSGLHDTTSLEDLCQDAVDGIADITGYDRVMVYRFDAQWRGCVVAERKKPAMSSYVGQSFPASDIPPQARQVFYHNASRMISDVQAPAVPLWPTLDPVTSQPLDMGELQLRAPSPVHLEYLRNMEVQGTFTLTVLVQQKLWGLIACHHSGPKNLDVSHRQAAEVVAKAFSALIPARLWADTVAVRQNYHRRAEALIERLRAPQPSVASLCAGDVNLGNLWAPAAGSAALLLDGVWHVCGKVPDQADRQALVAWLNAHHANMEVYHTDHLAEACPQLRLDPAVACGLLAVRLPKDEDAFILWFAPEVVQAIDWAGRPEKFAQNAAPGSIHPRRSFALWRQTVRGHSEPWSALQLDVALQLRRALIEWDLVRQVARERAARAQVEAEKQRFGLLAQASAFFGKPLRDGAALQGLVQFLTQQFCEWVLIAGPHDDPNIYGAMAHRHPAQAALLREAAAVGEILPHLTPLLAGVPNPQNVPLDRVDGGILAALGTASCIALPLTAHRRALGALYLARGPATAPFDADDTRLALQLAERVAGVLDNEISYRESQSAIRSREYVLRIVSHDLRNPLGLVSLSSQTLRRRLQKTDVAGWQTSVNRIDRACASMERLIGDVLSAANIESETFAVRPQWLAADAFLMDVGQALEPLCQAAGLRFTLRGVSDGLRVYGDEDRLHQAIGNLVSNAIRFTPEGGTIAVGLSQQQGEVHITVSDSGQGISKAKISKIFDQFWQGDQGVQSGAGLGLFIVRGIVLAHGGRIWADSEVGQGTTFTFTCPAPADEVCGEQDLDG